MKYKMLVLDLDDTLLNNDLVVSPENKEALRQIHEQGIIITICSGRVSHSIIGVMKDIGLQTDNDYYISYNGAVVSNGVGHKIFYKTIDGSILGNLIDLGRKHEVDIQLYQDDDIIVEEFTPRTKQYEVQSRIKVTITKDLKIYNESIKVLYNCDDISKLENIQEIIRDKYNDEVHVFFSKPTYLEVIHKDANKGLALAFLSNYLHINQEHIIAVGDSMNDIYMIEYAGMGVAVQNGRDEVKEVANHTTQATNHEHAISEVIRMFLLG